MTIVGCLPETVHFPFHWRTALLALDVVVVATAQGWVFVVDRARGTRGHTLSLGVSLSTMWGPAVIVEAGGGQQ